MRPWTSSVKICTANQCLSLSGQNYLFFLLYCSNPVPFNSESWFKALTLTCRIKISNCGRGSYLMDNLLSPTSTRLIWAKPDPSHWAYLLCTLRTVLLGTISIMFLTSSSLPFWLQTTHTVFVSIQQVLSFSLFALFVNCHDFNMWIFAIKLEEKNCCLIIWCFKYVNMSLKSHPNIMVRHIEDINIYICNNSTFPCYVQVEFPMKSAPQVPTILCLSWNIHPIYFLSCAIGYWLSHWNKVKEMAL